MDFPALNGPVTRILGKYTVRPTSSRNVYGTQDVRRPPSRVSTTRRVFLRIPPRIVVWNSTTKSHIDWTSWTSASPNVQLMNMKHTALPTPCAVSISSRQYRITSFRSNRSARNSMESITTRAGRLSRRAVLITLTMWSRSSMFVIRCFSVVGRRSWVDVASTNRSRSAGNGPNEENSRRASWGARKKST